MMHGRLGAMHVLGVPGNPVSSFVCAFLFLVPLIRRLPGAAISTPDRIGEARRRLPENDERADYLRATLDTTGRSLIATPFRPGQFDDGAAREGRLSPIREPYAPAASGRQPLRHP